MPYQNILLIDDDDDDRELFSDAIKDISAAAVCSDVGNAKEALRLLQERKIQPQIIFLDLNMPLMNGQQFLIEIKKDPELALIPVIMYSTLSHAASIQLMLNLGAAGFITKPDNYPRLVEILSAYII